MAMNHIKTLSFEYHKLDFKLFATIILDTIWAERNKKCREEIYQNPRAATFRVADCLEKILKLRVAFHKKHPPNTGKPPLLDHLKINYNEETRNDYCIITALCHDSKGRTVHNWTKRCLTTDPTTGEALEHSKMPQKQESFI